MHRLLASLVVLPLLLTAGCGDGDETGRAAPTTSSSASTAPTAPVPSAEASGSVGVPDQLLADPLVREAFATAGDEVRDLLGFTPDNVPETLERLRGRSSDQLAGRLDDVTQSLVDAVRNQGLSSTGTVLDTGLAAYDGRSATVLVAARAALSNTNTESNAGTGPTTSTSSIRLGLVRVDGTWLVDSLEMVGVGGRPSTDDTLDSVGIDDVPGHVAEVLSYTPDDVLSGLRKERAYFTQEIGTEYTHIVRRSIAPIARRRDVTSTTSVSGAGLVEASAPDRATLLLFVDSENKAGQKSPARTASRITVPVVLVDGDWLIAGLDVE